MSTRVTAALTTGLSVALVAVLVYVVVRAHDTVGWSQLATMLAALAGLLVMLAVYNVRRR